MCKAHTGIRRSLKLDSSLKRALDKRSTLLRDEPVEQVPRDPPFKPSLCHVLGVCVCSGNQKALWCHENLARLFRHVLWKKRKSEERSLTRQLVEDGMLCLEIRPPNMQLNCEDVDSDDALSTLHHGDAWDDCFQDEKKSIERIESRKPLFFFIGQINLRNMHFTVLQLQQTTPLQAEFRDEDETDETLNQVCYLQPSAATQNTDDMQKCIFTDMEIFTKLLDLEKPWSLRFHGFSGISRQWIGPEIPVTLVPDMEEMVFWKGFSEEQYRRRLAYAAYASKTCKQHGKATKRPAQGGVRIGAKRQRSTQRAITRDTDEQSDHDQVEGESNEAFDAFNVASHVYDEPDSDANDEGETNTPDDQLEQEQPAEPNIDEVLSEATVQDDIQDELFSNVESDADMETTGQDVDPPANPADAEVAQAEVAQADPPANPAADAEDPHPREPATRAVGVRGGQESRDVFELPDGSGTLRYYHASGSMQAFCCLGRSLHSSDCRKSATCCPVKRGSGRPIGLLVAWLQAAIDFDDKTEHVHSCRPTYEARKAAREWFMTLPGASDFCSFEKPKAPGDPDEPHKT